MTFPDVNSYQRKEPYIDTATFLGASLTFCAMKGGPLFDQYGVGCLLAAAANSMSITVISKLLHINEKTSYLLKICAVISVLAFSSFALPFVVMSLAAKTTIFLNYEVGVVFAIGHLVTKISFYVLYRIACAIKNRNPQPLPPLPIEKIETTKLPQFMINFRKKIHAISFPEVRSFFHSKTLNLTVTNVPWRAIGFIAINIFSLTTYLVYSGYSTPAQGVHKILPPPKPLYDYLNSTENLSKNETIFSEVKQIFFPTNAIEQNASELSSSALIPYQTLFFQNIFTQKKAVEFIPTQIKTLNPTVTKNLTHIFFPAVTILSGLVGLILYGPRAKRELDAVINS